MTKSRMDHLEEQMAELNHGMGEVKIAVELIREKQGSHTQRFDGIQASFHRYREDIQERFKQMEKRLHQVEDFVLSSVQRLSDLKGFVFKVLPFLAAFCVICFSIGKIWDDTEKVVTEVKQHDIEKKT